MFLGIDLTCSENKPSACALLNLDGSLADLGFKYTNDEIVELANHHGPEVVAIDAPLGFPQGMDCLEEDHHCQSDWDFKGRLAERRIIELGMSIYVITKRTFIKPMVYRAIELKEVLQGQLREVIEVYPYGSKVRLFGNRIPRKTTRAGLEFLQGHLNALIPTLNKYRGQLDHDLYDALVAAYTAYIYRQGLTEALGIDGEGKIVLPVSIDTVEDPC